VKSGSFPLQQNKNMLLVKFDENWADEMDVSGFKLFKSQKAWDKAIKEFKEEKEIEDDDDCCFSVYFGTNEENEYESMSEFLDLFEVIELSNEQANVIDSLFPEASCSGFGHFPI
jgi:hypothetical protein